MNEYDVLVIGAGNGGLVAGITLQKAGKQVLILESGRVPGGFASSFKRGNFEFEASLQELCAYGSRENPGELYKLFERLNIYIPFVLLKEAFYALTLDTNEKYVMPCGKEKFINQMEEYVPGSKEAMTLFFDLCEEITEALTYLRESKGTCDEVLLKEKYQQFVTMAPYTLEKGLKKINMPKKAIEILSSYWVYLGSPANQVSFVHYATIIYSYIVNGPVIPLLRSHDISVALEEEFKKAGGAIKYLSPVSKIIVEENAVKGVITKDNQEYRSNHIIANISPNVVYGSLIEEKNVPKKARQLTNSRTLGARSVCVYLGLNKSPEELGLTKYSYFITHTLDSNKEYDRMKNLFSGNTVGVVLNNGLENASLKGTTILTLTSLIFGASFDKEVTKENYFELKEKIADTLITSFEIATKTVIREAIEEIEVATPVTFARYTKHPDGVIHGYQALKYDNLVPRLMNEEEEQYIKGLRFCGGFGSLLSGFHSAYLSGEDAALKTKKEMTE